MPCTVTVLYPGGKTDDGKDSNFNTDYYRDSHMPMVLEELKQYGMTGYKVISTTGTPDPNTPAPYSTVCLLYMKDSDGFKKGLGATGEKLLGDIPNFTNTQPILMIGDDVADK